MTRRSITWILCLAAIALACGPHARHGDADAHASVPNAKQGADHPLTDTSLAASAKVAVSPGTVSFALRVTNLAPHSVEVNFPSGKTHEFVVVDTVGREIWRSSTGKMFTQAVQNRNVDANETLSFNDQWKPEGRHGKYTALASMRSSNHPVEERVDFVLP
jgi:intracellular proteinase inhibitor BsuPI